MVTYLYLDDEREPKTDFPWDIVRTYDDFIEHITDYGFPDVMSLDHDLGEEHTGYDCVNWMIEYGVEFGIDPNEILFNIHSANPVGTKRMKAAIESWKRYYARHNG